MKIHLYKMDVLADEMRGTSQRLASREQDARQPRLIMETDGPASKTRERMVGAAKAVQIMHGVSFSANRVNPGPMCSTSFGVKAEPPALPCRGDFLVENGAAAPKSCLRPSEMRSPTAAGGLLPAGMTSTATRITFHQPPLWFCPTVDTNLRTSIQYALYYNSSFCWNQLPAPSWRMVIQTKSRQNMILDPGGSKGRLRACPFSETWRALLVGSFLFWSGWW